MPDLDTATTLALSSSGMDAGLRTLLPSLAGLRDNLWADAAVGTTSYIVWWLVRRARAAPRWLLWQLLFLGFLFLSFSGQAAIVRYGPLAMLPVVLVLLAPPAALVWYDRRSGDAQRIAQQTVGESIGSVGNGSSSAPRDAPSPPQSSLAASAHAPLVRFVEDDHAGYLSVQNVSPDPVIFHALISVNSGIPDWPNSDRFACWDQLEGSHLEIQNGSTRRLVIARLQRGRGRDGYRWSVPYISGGKASVAFSSFFMEQSFASRAKLDVTVTLSADSAPKGPWVWFFGIGGRKIYQKHH